MGALSRAGSDLLQLVSLRDAGTPTCRRDPFCHQSSTALALSTRTGRALPLSQGRSKITAPTTALGTFRHSPGEVDERAPSMHPAADRHRGSRGRGKLAATEARVRRPYHPDPARGRDMAEVRRRSARALTAGLLLALGLALGGGGPAGAAEEAPAAGLYDRPVLVVDPGVHTAVIRRLDADREGRFLVTASEDKTVRVWAAEDGRLLRTLRLPAGPGDVGKAFAAAISPDGALVAAGGWTSATGSDESVYLFDRASGRLLRRVGGLPNVVNHLAFSPDGTRLAATLGAAGVRLIDPAAGRVVAADEGYGGEQLRGRVRRRGPARDHELRRQGPALRPGAAPAARGRGAGRQAALRDRLLARRRAARGRLRRHDRGRRARRGHAPAPVRGRHQGRGQRQPRQRRLVGGRRQPLRRRAVAGRRRASACAAGRRAGGARRSTCR